MAKGHRTSRWRPHSCRQRVVDACAGLAQEALPCGGQPSPERLAFLPPGLSAWRVLQAQRVILWGCWGTEGAGYSLGEAGRTGIPRKAFSFFKSAVFCQNKGQERSCELPLGFVPEARAQSSLCNSPASCFPPFSHGHTTLAWAIPPVKGPAVCPDETQRDLDLKAEYIHWRPARVLSVSSAWLGSPRSCKSQVFAAV